MKKRTNFENNFEDKKEQLSELNFVSNLKFFLICLSILILMEIEKNF